MAGAGAVFLVQTVLFLGSKLDDPYIFARYASNLLRYGDLVWNPGEPRIEGFSSWAWLGVYLVGTNVCADPVVFARLAGISSALLLVVLFGRRVEQVAGRYGAAALAMALVATAPDLSFIAASGMDHPLWCLATWCFLARIGSAGRLSPADGVLASCGVLLRPEGFLLFVPLAALAWWERRDVPVRRRLDGMLRLLAPGVLLLAFLVAARYVAFGALLPNAAAAKHFGGSVLLRLTEGTLYAGHAVALYLLVPAAALIVEGFGALRGASDDPDDRTAVACVAFVGSLVAFVIVAGGDDAAAFGPARLLTPAIAPAAFVMWASLRRVGRPSVHGPATAAALIALLLVSRAPAGKSALQSATGATVDTSARALLTAWRSGLQPAPRDPLADYLVRETPPGEAIAVPWAGLIPYQTGLPVIDMNGLNDATIRTAPVLGRGVAGSRDYADYVLARRPYFICENYVVRGPTEVLAARSDADFYAMGAFLTVQRNLLRDPRFARAYAIAPDAPFSGTCFRRIDGP